VEVVLGVNGIEALRREIKKYEAFMATGVNKIAERLAIIAEEVMLSLIPQGEIDGNISGIVTREPIVDGQRISYEGEDVAYIEFGTGIVGAESPHPKSSEFEWHYDINQHGWKGWYYTHKLTGEIAFSVGIPPISPVYDTAREIQKRAVEIISEVIDEEFS